MQLQDLNHRQQLALVALLECFALSDNTISEGEAEEIKLVAEAFGDETFRALLDEVNAEFEDESDLQDFLEADILDQDARDLIFGLILDLTMSSPVVHPRIELLDWLRATWDIAVTES